MSKKPEKVRPKLESINGKIPATLPTSSTKTKVKDGRGDSLILSKLDIKLDIDPKLKAKDQIQNTGHDEKQTTDKPKRSSSARVHAFYYPWYGNPQHDGRSMPGLSASRFAYGTGN